MPEPAAEQVPATGPIASGVHRNAGIDLLRGLAIVFVLLNHLGLPMRIPLKASALADMLPVRLLQALNYNGYEAVFVFFVISGFLIAGNALQRWGSLARIELKAFYARRFARIVPCLLALLAVLAVLHGLGTQDYAIHRSGQSLGGAVLAALGLHLNWYEGRTGYLPGSWDVLWSLSIEEVFYLGFPLACLLVRRTRVLVPLLLALALSLPWTRAALEGNGIWQEKAYLPGMAAIATGVLGALWLAGSRLSPRSCRVLRWAGALGLAGATLGGHWLWPLLHEGVMLLLTGSTLALLAAFRIEPPRVPAPLRWLCSWGRLSYEIYLSHMFVVFAITRMYRWSGADARTGFLWYLPAFVLCWALGALVMRCWSMPCERWLRDRWLRPATIPVDVAYPAR
ncbi:acyltransferase family protein [Frateuria hangzhouensis]|uniref:acyltransferase family protein n=1 Tax=Frateuria hangzhouensis TaxID=2995589 RepID=UPI002260A3F9|nr:acyltransferase [Frateuria sp. STR12]MCX7512990.1 acyltransferase [Frateuria sp. STR12]